MTSEKLQNLILETESKYNIKILYVTKTGSQLYGTASEDSDTDYTGIYVPAKSTVFCDTYLKNIDLSSNKSNQKNTSADIDFTLRSIQEFGKLLLKGETNAIDLMFSVFDDSSTVIIDYNFAKYIQSNYHHLISKNCHAFISYCNQQANKYTLKKDRYQELKNIIAFFNFGQFIVELPMEDRLENHWVDICNKFRDNDDLKYSGIVMAPGPRKTEEIEYLEILNRKFAPSITFNELMNRLTKLEQDYGNRARDVSTPVEWKSLYNAVRVLDEIEELLTDNFITFPLKNKDYIRKVKYQQLEEKDVREYLDSKIEKVQQLYESSKLPETAPQLAVNKLMLNFYK